MVYIQLLLAIEVSCNENIPTTNCNWSCYPDGCHPHKITSVCPPILRLAPSSTPWCPGLLPASGDLLVQLAASALTRLTTPRPHQLLITMSFSYQVGLNYVTVLIVVLVFQFGALCAFNYATMFVNFVCFVQSNSSQSNLMEMLHGGRPRNEEPHVKKSMKKHGEKVDLILRVDLVRLCLYFRYSKTWIFLIF